MLSNSNPHSSRTQELIEQHQVVQSRIDHACQLAGRDLQSVRLIWVSKTKPMSDVEAAIAAGAVDFGENKIQECQEKFAVSRPNIQLHVIGPVQSNKWRKAATLAQWIHSVDSLQALQKFQEVAQELNKIIHVCIQVNTSGEASKSGLSLQTAKPFLESLPTLSNVRYRGLMTIGVNSGNPQDARAGFAALRQLRDEFLAQKGHFSEFSELSMGMSDDLDVAIAEGATLVRIGTALFGSRFYV